MPNESKPMDHFLHIDVNAAQAMMEQKQAHLVDIRDPQSFQLAHAKNAYQQAEFDQPVLVMCYHGVSSQGAAQYLVNQGFEEVYSVDGGFEAWHRANLPIEAS